MSRFVNQKIIEDKYTCPICLGIYNQPQIITACGHTFCKRCLYGLERFTCPLCRRKFSFAGLVDNYRLEVEIRSARVECQECFSIVKLLDLESHQYRCRYFLESRVANRFRQEARISDTLNELLDHPVLKSLNQAFNFMTTFMIPTLITFFSTLFFLLKNIFSFIYFSSGGFYFVFSVLFDQLRKIIMHQIRNEPLPILLKPLAFCLKIFIFLYLKASCTGVFFLGLNFALKITYRLFSVIKHLAHLV